MRKIYLQHDVFTLVDDDDYEYLSQWTWHYINQENPRVIRNVSKKHKSVTMARLIMNTPKDMAVMHIDYDGLNNQKSNLMNCSQSDIRGHRYRHKNKNCDHYGVCKRKDGYGYEAQITINKKKISLGLYKTEEEAAIARDKYATDNRNLYPGLNYFERVSEYSNNDFKLTGRMQKNGSSKYVGVSWYPNRNKWRAWLVYDRKFKHLGFFDKEEDAVRARDLGMLRYYEDAAKLNFPEKINEYLCLINDTKKVSV